MSNIDDLVSNLHATITSGVPAPVSGYTTEEEAEAIFQHGDPMTGSFGPAPEPEAQPEEPYAGKPRTLNEVAVLAVSKPWAEGVEERRAVMAEHLGDNPRAWEAVLAEAEERGWIDSGALDAELTPAGVALAKERGWELTETELTEDGPTEPQTPIELVVLAMCSPDLTDRFATFDAAGLNDNDGLIEAAFDAGLIDCDDILAGLTQKGKELASERGWEVSERLHEIAGANAKDAIAWIKNNVTEWEHVDEARAAENSRPKPRVSVLAAIDKAEAKISEADALLDAMQAHEEEARNEAIRQHDDEQREKMDVDEYNALIASARQAQAQKQEEEQQQEEQQEERACTLMEVKAFAQETLKWVDADSESTLDKLCRMILSMDEKPAPKARKSSKRVAKTRVADDGVTVVRDYFGRTIEIQPAALSEGLDGKGDWRLMRYDDTDGTSVQGPDEALTLTRIARIIAPEKKLSGAVLFSKPQIVTGHGDSPLRVELTA